MAQVFVVDRASFFGGRWPHGFRPIGPAEASDFLTAAHAAGRFVDRAEAEVTPAWKQWIPYCVLRCRPSPGTETTLQPAANGAALTGIFHVQRTSGQGESRLHGAWSIGLGGHIDPEDQTPEGRPDSGATFFQRALARELTEELDFGCFPLAPRFVGLLNDERTPVGTVHAGLVHVWDLIGPLAQVQRVLRIREIRKMRGCLGSLVEFHELWQDPAKFESWSQILIEAGVVGSMAAN